MQSEQDKKFKVNDEVFFWYRKDEKLIKKRGIISGYAKSGGYLVKIIKDYVCENHKNMNGTICNRSESDVWSINLNS